jgi:DNA-binding HxlR family transcriptional regulator
VVRTRGTYGHFCMLARALEQIEDRWALLVVRDLASGPKRFTDLMERLGGITPKTLTQRLRDLEAEGLVAVDRVQGRRDVWYELTLAGRDLLPALDELLLWGLRHAARPPEPGEPAHPEHLLWALKTQLERSGVDPGPVVWSLRLLDDGNYVIRNDGHGWSVEAGDAPNHDLLVTASKDSWARFLASPATTRSTTQADIQITGERRAIRTFLKAIDVFPFGRPAPATADNTGDRQPGARRRNR